MQRIKAIWPILRDIITVIGGCGGFAALVFAGMLWKQVDVNTRRLDKIESNGSPTFLAHVTMDDQRITDMGLRLTRMEDTAKAMTEMKGDISALRVFAEERKVDQAEIRNDIREMKRSLDEHKQQTAAPRSEFRIDPMPWYGGEFRAPWYGGFTNEVWGTNWINQIPL